MTAVDQIFTRPSAWQYQTLESGVGGGWGNKTIRTFSVNFLYTYCENLFILLTIQKCSFPDCADMRLTCLHMLHKVALSFFHAQLS